MNGKHNVNRCFFFQPCMCLVIPYPSIDGRTPLLCAAKGGHYDVMTYLLQFRKVLSDLKEQEEKVDKATVRYI